MWNLTTTKAMGLIVSLLARHHFSLTGAFWHTAACKMYTPWTYLCLLWVPFHWQWKVSISVVLRASPLLTITLLANNCPYFPYSHWFDWRDVSCTQSAYAILTMWVLITFGLTSNNCHPVVAQATFQPAGIFMKYSLGSWFEVWKW